MFVEIMVASCVLSLGYIYRRLIFVLLLRSAIKVARYVVYLRTWWKGERVPEDIYAVDSIEPILDKSLVNLDIRLNGKIHHLKLILPLTCEQLPTKRFKSAVSQKTRLVHCSIMTESEVIVCDLTETIRQFCYHFDKDDECSKLKYFIAYVLSRTNYADRNMKFVLIRNNAMLTEYCEEIYNVEEKTFKEILNG